MQNGKLLHGGDYNPEQWLKYPDILEKDLIYMKQAHINTVSLGIFAWGALEPQEGVFQFKWMEEIVEKLYQNGISVILATPSGARPKWLSDRYPEVLRVSSDRHRNLFGGRHNHCYTSTVYREKTARINQELVKRIGNHPAVILWHISNEYGGECHCPLCQEAFRGWLKDKYQTIENLNDRWCTTFWSHQYQSFDQIESPSPRGESALHALTLDWKRFVSDQTTDFMRSEVEALRSAGSNLPVTANFMYDYAGLNYQKMAEAVDVVSWDTYPTWHKQPEWVTATDNGMQHDRMRSLKHAPYLMMESCPSSTNWQSVSKLKKPDMLYAASLQAIAHGSDSVLYFQIRQSQGSSEKFHGAVIDHYGGSDTRVFREVTKVGKALECLKEIETTNVVSEVAIVYDIENRWAMEDAQGPRNKGLFYKEAVEKSYSAFRRQGQNVDLIDMSQSLKNYKVVAAPMLYLFQHNFAEKVEAFVKAGGIFILTYWSGVVDDTDRCYLGGTPHDLMEVMGLRSTEIDGLYDGETNTLIPEAGKVKQQIYTCEHLCELIERTTATVLYQYGSDFYQGTPVVTENSYGDGKAYYIGADASQAFYDDFYQMILEESDVTRPFLENVPAEVEITTREDAHHRYHFLQNYGELPVKLEIPETLECLLGEATQSLPKYGTLILKEKKD